MRNDLISVCVPAYNNAKSLDRALKSVFNQRYKNYEVIVSDDSTTNEVENLAKKYAHKNLFYFRNRKQLGSPQNWNQALLFAKGEFIKILHHDDHLTDENSLEEYLNQISGKDIVFSSTNIVDINGKKIRNNIIDPALRKKIEKNPSSLITANLLGAPSTIFYKSSVHELFDPYLIWLVDVEFYIRLILQGYVIGSTKKLLVSTVHGEDNQLTQKLQSDKRNTFLELIRIVNIHGLRLNVFKNNEQVAWDLFLLGGYSKTLALLDPKLQRSFREKILKMRARNKLKRILKK